MSKRREPRDWRRRGVIGLKPELVTGTGGPEGLFSGILSPRQPICTKFILGNCTATVRIDFLKHAKAAIAYPPPLPFAHKCSILKVSFECGMAQLRSFQETSNKLFHKFKTNLVLNYATCLFFETLVYVCFCT